MLEPRRAFHASGRPKIFGAYCESFVRTLWRQTARWARRLSSRILRGPGRHVVGLTYLGNIEGQPQIDEESLEYGWFEEDEIKRLTQEELDIYFRALIDQGIIF